METTILILAAGSSSRMGTMKQLLPWEGTTLLGHVVNTAINSNADNTVLVLGAKAEEIEKSIKPSLVNLVVNENWTKGMGSSIAKGVEYISQSLPDTKAVLILLADQPFINKNNLNTYLDKGNKFPKKIIATNYGLKHGVPALFPKSFFKQLITLNRDYGAREILETNRENILALKNNINLVDLDTMKKYHQLKKI
ncbi:nucleotidyltransferase family protein [Eudoraea chungangensis]|uniref:nucleotidyltransferase family protein n=1 Tax=Eudoraea chungangensis TaxID=1481905 RepID=UPI0023EB7343|nr:nucleotidyltransferase family protein [Eudoraea chungangensis]